MQVRPKTSKLKTGLLLISSLALLMSILVAAGAFASGIAMMTRTYAENSSTILSFTGAMLFTFAALVHATALIHAIKKPSQAQEKILRSGFRMATAALLIWPGLMLLGHFVSRSTLDWLGLPILNLLVVLIPAWWLIEFASRKLTHPSQKRQWGVLSISISITPLFIIVLEVLIFIVAFLLLYMLLITNPQWMEQFTLLAQSAFSGELDYQSIEDFLLRLLQEPSTMVFLFITAVVIVPFFEELIKPLALWGLAQRKPTPAEGFRLGMLSGAAFALLESVGMISQFSGTDWAPMVLLRSSTGLLHICLSGLVGWGLACAWSEKKRLRMLSTLLVAAGLHGLWNALALSIGYSPSLFSPTTQDVVLSAGDYLAIVIMLVEFVGLFWLLEHLQKTIVRENIVATHADVFDQIEQLQDSIIGRRRGRE